uniref:Uncharacterized protein n=1 Tax=Avena sativa TaxID=4498 RepID=A0ACD5YHT9_AVESA
MEQPSLESKAVGKRMKPGPRAASPRPRTTSARPRRPGHLAILSTPAVATSPPSENYEHEYEGAEFDMNDEMSESLPSHVSVDSGTKDEDGSVDGGGGSPKTKRCKAKNGNPVSSKPKAKRARGKTSKCWKHFTMTPVEGEPLPKAKCNYCGDLFLYKEGGQTTSLNRHNEICQEYKEFLRKGQIQGQGTLSFQPGGSSHSSVCTEYNHEETRKIIAKMFIVHDYPFRMVEHKWFNILMRHMNQKYKFIGRKTIRKECIKVYESEKELLKKSLRDVEHISLTCDLWTSNQTLSYMALVAHYIDADWVMQCRVLNFVELDPPHSGVIIAQAVMECLAEWKIEDKVISLTMDNASSNDAAAKNLMAKFLARKVPGFIPHHFHVNTHRFPVVSRMARRFLTIPATSVSSESTFSTGGRVLDDYRSSLLPAMVERLVCASSWIRGSYNDNKSLRVVVKDEDDDVELVPFPDCVVASS